ncbi:MAG: histone, partial [Bacteroidota bacterium]
MAKKPTPKKTAPKAAAKPVAKKPLAKEETKGAKMLQAVKASAKGLTSGDIANVMAKLEPKKDFAKVKNYVNLTLNNYKKKGLLKVETRDKKNYYLVGDGKPVATSKKAAAKPAAKKAAPAKKAA